MVAECGGSKNTLTHGRSVSLKCIEKTDFIENFAALYIVSRVGR